MLDYTKYIIENQQFAGERPLYGLSNVMLNNVVTGEGESAIKEGQQIEAEHCRFEGKYVCWEIDGLKLTNCTFADSARASLWYVRGLKMQHCQVDAPKAFRHVERAEIEDLVMPQAEDVLWHCQDVEIRAMQLTGNYPLQYVKNIEIRNSRIEGRDALWESDNCTVYDSELSGAYLGWYSRNLRLVRCHIAGTQPLCYAENLILEDCTFDEDADLAFEYSSVKATIKGSITSIKNPKSGSIVAEEIGEITDNAYHCDIQTQAHI